jgi:two-component system cell cycle sensor histidine kinase/response regulator CckA
MGTSLRLLIVEDSEDDATLLVRELKCGGFDVDFHRVDTAGAMKTALDSQEWDLVISDYSMPHFSGLKALEILRERGPDIPFIFVSGTIGEETAVATLKVGAQDYVLKTNLKRLVPSIQRELHEVKQRRERKHLEEQVRQLQKFEAIGQLAGGVAHDFNNVIGAILGWAEMGEEECPIGSPMRERFQKIRDQADRAAGLTRQLLAFARRQLLQPRNINLNEIVSEAGALLQKLIGEDVEMKFLLAPELHVTRADPTQVEQILMNLCVNARDAMPQGGRLIIETKNAEIDDEYCRIQSFAQPGHYVLLAVSDTGMGMDRSTMEHIFEPFFTTKELGKGTGLGLATVYGIVKQHGGIINVYSEPNHGTTFRVYLPAIDGAAESLGEVKNEVAQGGTETILVAEDHDGLREAAQLMLEGLGYRVILAKNGMEAVRLFEQKRDSIGLVLLDVVMPGLNGPDAYTRIAAVKPDVRVLFTTGYTTDVALPDSILQKGAAILQKPYSVRDLGRAVRSALDRERRN